MISTIVVFIFKLYKLLFSPILRSFFGNACRFSPSCGDYALEAVQKFGSEKGIILAFKRIMKCHPFSNGFVDPVPQS